MTSGRVEMPKIDLVLTQDEIAVIADDLLHAERVTIAYLENENPEKSTDPAAAVRGVHQAQMIVTMVLNGVRAAAAHDGE